MLGAKVILVGLVLHLRASEPFFCCMLYLEDLTQHW